MFTDAFYRRLIELGEAGHWDPKDMLTLFAGESSLIPTAKNASGAEGLSQLMPATRKNLGWDDAVRGSFAIAPPEEQISFTAAYFAYWMSRFRIPRWESAGHLWQANLMPATLAHPGDPIFDRSVWKAGWAANRWLDIDGNGRVTREELDAALLKAVAACRTRYDEAIANLERVRAEIVSPTREYAPNVQHAAIVERERPNREPLTG